MKTSSEPVCIFFQAEDGIRYLTVTGVQTCALPISPRRLSVVESCGGSSPMARSRSISRPRGSPRPLKNGSAGSGEGRVGEECRSRGVAVHLKKKKVSEAERGVMDQRQ